MKKLILFLVLIASCSFASAQSLKWTAIDSIRIYNSDSTATSSFFFKAIDCYDNENCIAIGNLFGNHPWNRVTTNGGRTWKTTLKDTSFFDNKDSVWYIPAVAHSVAYPGKNLCVIGCDSGYYWRSTDNCQTWKKGKIPVKSDYAIKKISFINEKNGVALDMEELFLTSDGGENWEKADLKFPDSLVHSYFSDVTLLNENFIIVNIATFKFFKTRIYYSYDFGKTWNYFEPQVYRLTEIKFINEKHGWAIGSHRTDSTQYNYNDVILHTIDGGKTWEIQLDTLTFSYQYPLDHIYFPDSLNGFALGRLYKLWRTTDGGKHWEIDEEYKKRVTNGDLIDIYPFSKDYFLGITRRESALIYRYQNLTDYSEYFAKSSNFNEYLIVSPNPATDFIQISYPSYDHTLKGMVEGARIYDVFGREALNNCELRIENCELASTPSMLRIATPREGNLKIDVSSLTPGLYFVRVGDRVGKFVKL